MTESGQSDEGRNPWKGQAFEIEASDDLTAWSSLGMHTKETGTLEVSDPDAGPRAYRYYRAKQK